MKTYQDQSLTARRREMDLNSYTVILIVQYLVVVKSQNSFLEDFKQFVVRFNKPYVDDIDEFSRRLEIFKVSC